MIFKLKKGELKTVELTPEMANKITKKAIIRNPSYDDCLRDISARAEMEYTWTYMLQIKLETIDKLKEKGWNIKHAGHNTKNETFMIRISW